MIRAANSLVAQAIALTFVSFAAAGAPAPIRSTFDTDDEGWSVVDLTFPAVGNPPPVLATYIPVHSASGGSPGGHVSLNDPSANVMYWKAPPPSSAIIRGCTAARLPTRSATSTAHPSSIRRMSSSSEAD